MPQINCIVPRENREEITYAMVQADHDGDGTVKAFLQSLSDALQAWHITADGIDADMESAGTFNVGDLAEWSTAPSLITCLAKHGITKLTVETYSQNCHPMWYFDDHLME